MSGEERLSAEEMDEIRRKNMTYQYLCYLEEAKTWIESCIDEELPDVGTLEEELRHGVFLAKLACFFSPQTITMKKIYDRDLIRYRSSGLNFRHTDNINYFLKACKDVGLPKIVHPETADIYNKSNIPKAVFCIHALSLYLFRLGIAPQKQDLFGKITFSDEVMSAMMKELSKFGCQLPQFGKIGGILANELPVDEAALHAAIIAINDAVQKMDVEELKQTLTNPSSHLSNIILRNIASYCSSLHAAQNEKRETALNKTRNESYILDAYDELLSQSEIQGYIIVTNVKCAVEMIETGINNNNESVLMEGLTCEGLALSNVRKNLCTVYLKELEFEMKKRRERMLNHSLNESFVDCTLSKSSIQNVINYVNKREAQKDEDNKKLKLLNECLLNDTHEKTYETLLSLKNHFEDLMKYAAPLYHEELGHMRRTDCMDGLTLSQVASGVKFLTAIGYVNAAIETGNPEQIWEHISNPSSNLENLNRNYDYSQKLISLFERKQRSESSCKLLTYFDLQDVVDVVNDENEIDQQKIAALAAVNEALFRRDTEALLLALSSPVLNINVVNKDNCCQFLLLLERKQFDKSQIFEEEDTELWMDDINEIAELIEKQEADAGVVTKILSQLNKAIRDSCVENVINALRDCVLLDFKISNKLIGSVAEKLLDRFSERVKNVTDPWITYVFPDGSLVYINIEEETFNWSLSSKGTEVRIDVNAVNSYVNIGDLINVFQLVIKESSANTKIGNSIVYLQAACRGFLVRRKVQLWRSAALKIQTWWRMVSQRRAYVMYRTALRLCEPKIIVIQRAFRAWREKKHFKMAMKNYKEKEDKIIIIQRAWRKYKAKIDLKSLTNIKNPSLSVLRKFIELLQVSRFDLEEELRLQHVKSDVASNIRKIHELESKIDEMDVKIGLLVRNRITLQDVIKSSNDKENENPNQAQKKNKKHGREKGHSTPQKGLKDLKKDSREKLIAYQHLFYHLQINPRYLSDLIYGLPNGQTSKFFEDVLFTLFNYGSNDRDNYLLLNVLKLSLEEEIRNRVMRLSDMISTNPLIIRIIVSLHRKGHGQSKLKEIVGPLIEEVLKDSTLHLNTNPVEIYRNWVNQIEMGTGNASNLPYVVKTEEALQYPEVQSRLNTAVQLLREYADMFCSRIVSSKDLVPYSMRYMAKVMKRSLHNRFPHAQEKDILKAVGNMIYYKYINSAIVAPDAYNIISPSPDKKLTNDQRRNLGIISKILQYSTLKRGFGDESPHLIHLNGFIIDCHEKFKVFVQECCEVEEPEKYYNFNQYTEDTMIFKPTVTMTQQEIALMHELLLANEEAIAPEPNDPLHELLQDCGEKISHSRTHIDSSESAVGSVANVEVCLALSAKLQLKTTLQDGKKEEKDSNAKLFNKTKQLLVDVVQCVDGDDLFRLTTGPTLPEQEQKFQQIISTRLNNELTAKKNETDLNTSNDFLTDSKTSLSESKTKLSHNLRRLENRGIATRANNYQTLLNSVAQDIVNQGHHRIARRNELNKLVTVCQKLIEKESFYKEQLMSYYSYLNTCLTNLASRNKNVHKQVLTTKPGKISKKYSVKYTGARLHERGVILEIEELPHTQLKNVLLEITPLAQSGVFRAQVNFMGVGMETVEVDIQDLLQLQYEGVSVKKMFGKVKVNVNLLLHLLNSKFYSKKK
ncbi:UNVERIFIED_CONTAM: hypothetical protein RMT77_017468 [Armadillidium vulgare]